MVALALLAGGYLAYGRFAHPAPQAGAGDAATVQAQAVDCGPAPYNSYNGTASCMGLSSGASGIGATALGSLAQADVLGALAVGGAGRLSADRRATGVPCRSTPNRRRARRRRRGSCGRRR